MKTLRKVFLIVGFCAIAANTGCATASQDFTKAEKREVKTDAKELANRTEEAPGVFEHGKTDVESTVDKKNYKMFPDRE